MRPFVWRLKNKTLQKSLKYFETEFYNSGNHCNNNFNNWMVYNLSRLLPGMCTCMYLICQSSALHDDVALFEPDSTFYLHIFIVVYMPQYPGLNQSFLKGVLKLGYDVYMLMFTRSYSGYQCACKHTPQQGPRSWQRLTKRRKWSFDPVNDMNSVWCTVEHSIFLFSGCWAFSLCWTVESWCCWWVKRGHIELVVLSAVIPGVASFFR